MPNILGQSQPQRSILGGSYHPIRQVAAPQAQPMQAQASPLMMMGGQGGAPQYGSDEWAMATGGPGAMIWRELARYMSGHGKAPLGFLDPKEKAFSPELRALLGPQFQKGGK